MTDSQLDEIFKKQLPGHESPVPEDMWERIIRKKDRDRKGFFFFFSLIGLFILGFVTASILLFHINRKEVFRIKQPVSDSNSVSSTAIVQPNANDQDLKKDSSLNSVAGDSGGSILQKPSMQKNYFKNKISSKDCKTEIQHAQSVAKSNSGGTGQTEANANAVGSLSANANSRNNGKISGDSSSLTSPKANPAESSPNLLAANSANNTAVTKLDSPKKEAGKKWSLDLYGSPDFPIDDGHEYVKGNLSYTIGLKVNRSFSKHFSGKIGIQYSQLNVDLADTSGFPGPYHLIKFDLPVMVGYSWGNKTFGMTVNGGVIFNLYSRPHLDSANFIKSNTGLSLYLGLNFSKHINDRMDIFSEPYYRYQISTSTVSTFYYRKFINVVGISFGVRYYIGK